MAMEPKPAQRPGPPIWLGDRHPDALTRAARISDGRISADAGSTSTDQFSEHAVVLQTELQAQKRKLDGFTVGKRVYITVDDEASRDEQRLRYWTEGRYGLVDLSSRVGRLGSDGDMRRGPRPHRGGGRAIPAHRHRIRPSRADEAHRSRDRTGAGSDTQALGRHGVLTPPQAAFRDLGRVCLCRHLRCVHLRNRSRRPSIRLLASTSIGDS